MIIEVAFFMVARKPACSLCRRSVKQNWATMLRVPMPRSIRTSTRVEGKSLVPSNPFGASVIRTKAKPHKVPKKPKLATTVWDGTSGIREIKNWTP